MKAGGGGVTPVINRRINFVANFSPVCVGAEIAFTHTHTPSSTPSFLFLFFLLFPLQPEIFQARNQLLFVKGKQISCVKRVDDHFCCCWVVGGVVPFVGVSLISRHR